MFFHGFVDELAKLGASQISIDTAYRLQRRLYNREAALWNSLKRAKASGHKDVEKLEEKLRDILTSRDKIYKRTQHLSRSTRGALAKDLKSRRP